jgi:protein required for attachment to host cells
MGARSRFHASSAGVSGDFYEILAQKLQASPAGHRVDVSPTTTSGGQHMSAIWVLAADSSHARFFSTDSPIGDLKEDKDLAQAESQLPEREMGTDRPGRSFDSAGQGRHAMEEPTSTKETAAREFARRIAERVEKGRQQNAFERLYIIAAPDFLGHLRDQLPDTCKNLVQDSIDKNVVKQDPASIRAQLPERL